MLYAFGSLYTCGPGVVYAMSEFVPRLQMEDLGDRKFLHQLKEVAAEPGSGIERSSRNIEK